MYYSTWALFYIYFHLFLFIIIIIIFFCGEGGGRGVGLVPLGGPYFLDLLVAVHLVVNLVRKGVATFGGSLQ